ncbi:hypothetical protein G7054_g7397 [Neopestalotiopsis clavispora]|nr:hypothetical protein G7054_g7397 [Neopestalotiopsis clavispora]
MRLLLPLFLGILPYSPDALVSAQRIAIDPVTCAGDVGNNIAQGLRTAIGWAQQAFDELNKPDSERNAKVTEKVDMLFGASASNMQTLRNTSIGVALFTVTNSNPRDQAWKDGATFRYLEVYCTADHLVFKNGDDGKPGVYPIFDEVRKLFVPEITATSDLMNKNKATMAVTFSTPPEAKRRNKRLEKVADTMIINEGWIPDLKKNNFNHFTQALVDAAANPSALKKINQVWDGIAQWGARLLAGESDPPSAADLMDSLERLLLHELTHTSMGTQTLDTPPGKCYFWRNCVKAKGRDDATRSLG